MAYEKTVWVNGQAPALDAEHLNKMEQGIADAVSVTPQTLSTEQQAQARGNIGAAKGGLATDWTNIPTPAGETIYGRGSMVYCRDAIGNVYINSTNTRLAAAIAPWQNKIIGILPEGFRPAVVLSAPIFVAYGMSSIIVVSDSGEIIVYAFGDEVSADRDVVANFSFPAVI
jgi:hypothetical protein